ncbi:MAG: 1-deoxy-D-xylulose-5-phosphate synthase [Clostridia bacterium]|nr:1-deoxy-D-xylulose-5-phosphate synthase [Clostridia bacterium]
MEYKFLEKIQDPRDIKQFNSSEISELCNEIRDVLVNTVSKNGGHLASNLGIVELTIALHRVFDSPKDAILFDVGHQSYVHKILTGRLDRFSEIRKQGGLSGFMRPDESEHDPFVTGHASNSLAAAFGIYNAKKIKGEEGTAVAIIGDGALTGGLAFEALNNIGNSKGNFIVVLNDNKMSISKNVGSLAAHLNKIRIKPSYHRLKNRTEKILLKLPLGKQVHSFVSRLKKMFKGFIYRTNVFEGLGFNYFGPLDGHNVESIEAVLKIAKAEDRPSVVHIITTKGKGYPYAEDEPGSYHGVSAFDAKDGLKTGGNVNFSSVCGNFINSAAEKDEKICAITAAMPQGTGLELFAQNHKDRFFDVGIAEEYAVTFASGLAISGMKPYFSVYSSFLQRGYDEIIHDTAIANLPVRFLVDRAGIVGEDGETHQGVFDVAFLSTIPNMTIYSPASYKELVGCLESSLNCDSPLAIRYPRGKEKYEFDYNGKDYTVFQNSGKVAIVTFGIISSNALIAQQNLSEKGIKIDVIKLNKLFPYSEKLISLLNTYEKLYFFEEGVLNGGISQQIASNLQVPLKITAIENAFIPSMTTEAAYKKCNLSAKAMVEIIESENS